MSERATGKTTGPPHRYPPLPCCHQPFAPPRLCQPAIAAPAAIWARAAGLPSISPCRDALTSAREFIALRSPLIEADRRNEDLPPKLSAPPTCATLQPRPHPCKPPPPL